MFEKVNPKQSFPELEKNILKFWKENKIFEKSVESRSEKNLYRFFDGPPFITGTPHYGSLLSSICKDIVPRYQTMKGKRVERLWGWDCHGIPIEDKVQKKLGIESTKDIEKIGVKKFIEECYNYTRETSAEWEWYVDHIGRWVDFENSYKTMDQDYMESTIWVFSQLYKKGLVYKGQRSSLYSRKLSTPISNFEIAMDNSYKEVSDPAITVMFELKNEDNFVKKGDYLLAWTTTPWTIPAHMAIAVNKELEYSRILSDNKYYILATPRIETVFRGKEYEIIENFSGENLVGLKYIAPFSYYQGKVDENKNHIVYDADFVTDTDGTGIAHEAPEFGDVDFELAKEEGIHISNALDKEGNYTSEIDDLKGTHYLEGNNIVMKRLKEKGLLFKKESINHRVAMCPRTGTPLIYKAQDSWFIDIKFIKDKLIEKNKEINWSPEHLKFGRFQKSIESAPDWCVSRTRYWGTPMPIWGDKNENMKIFGSVEEIFNGNKIYGQIEKKDNKYYFTNTKKEFDLHRPFIDEILIENENNFKAQNVLGIHGRGSDINNDSWKKIKKDLENEGINFEFFQFDRSQDPTYESWKETFEKIDFSKYDTVYASSLGGAMTVKYLFEKDIKVKRLIMKGPGVSNTIEKGEKPNTQELYQSLPKKIEKKLADEIIVIHAKDDEIVPFRNGKSFAKKVGAKFIQLEKGGHKLDGSWEFVKGLIKKGTPLKRIPEVLDVWLDSSSMPYAQVHYPFENKNKFDSSFPADFIVEYIGQVRAWFYVMHTIGVALFDKPAFKNVITTGVVYGSDGRKMSKSYKNYPDPRETIEKYGADAIRFYMINSPLLNGGDMSFVESGVEEVIKKVILPLWNTYSFFTTYANIDKFEKENNGNIYFVRHGETQNNVLGKMSGGEDDTPLNKTGIEQSIKAGEIFRNSGIKIDKIYVSPRLRTKKTAELILKELGYECEIIEDKRLIEQYSGKFYNKTHKEIIEENNLKTIYEMRFLYKENNGIENIEEFEKRVLEVYKEIKKENIGKNILIVSHTGVFRPINRYLNNLTKKEAHFDGDSCNNGIIYKLPEFTKSNNLDKWIISELNKLIKDVTYGLDNYKLNESTKSIVKFMDNLTNWYIRRSRKRFWTEKMEDDKFEAYNTLYEVLVELCKIIAPFMPFISEHIYKELTGNESIHLDIYPESNKAFIFEDLNESMKKTQDIVSLGLAVRARERIRVRQPLSYLKITDDLDNYYKDIIKEELNVKEIKVFANSEMPKQICKPDARIIGPKFGKDVKFILSEAKSGNFELLENGNVKVGNFELLENEYTLEFETNFREGRDEHNDIHEAFESGNGLVISMDMQITPDLKQEGYARDLVRHIQETRKEAEYNVDDRIKISFNGDLEEIVNNFGEYISNETLGKIVEDLENFDIQKEIEIEDLKVVLKLKK